MPTVPVVVPDGDRIRERREELQLSRDEVAARMARHRHPKQIAMIEYGVEQRVSKSYMEELAEVLGKPVGEFIKADAPKTNGNAA